MAVYKKSVSKSVQILKSCVLKSLVLNEFQNVFLFGKFSLKVSLLGRFIYFLTALIKVHLYLHLISVSFNFFVTFLILALLLPRLLLALKICHWADSLMELSFIWNIQKKSFSNFFSRGINFSCILGNFTFCCLFLCIVLTSHEESLVMSSLNLTLPENLLVGRVF